MKRCDVQGFHSFVYDSSTPQKSTNHIRRYAKPNQAESEVKVKVDKHKITFKYGLEVSKYWKIVARIDLVAGNNNW